MIFAEFLLATSPLLAAGAAIFVLNRGVTGRLSRDSETQSLWLVFGAMWLLAFPLGDGDPGTAAWVVVTSGVLIGLARVIYRQVVREGVEIRPSLPYLIWMLVFAVWLVSLVGLVAIGMRH